MRILYVHGDPRGPGEGGGAESLLRDQSRAMRELGHSSAWWYGEGSLAEAVDSFKPDLLHFMTVHCYPMGIAPLEWAQAEGIPHLMHVQDYWPFCRPRMLLVNSDQSCSAVRGTCGNECGGRETRYLDTVNRSYIVAGNAHTAGIYRRNGLRCDAVVELGVDTGLFSPDPSPGENRPVSIITTSAWPEFPVKGMHILRKAIEGTPHSAGLITGVPREQVAAGLRRADIFAFPSCYEETFGLALCEAMATGCCVIASDVAGARAQVHDGTGVLVPPRDAYSLYEAIRWLSQDHEVRIEMGLLAREHVAADHSLEAMGRRWEAVYREVLGGS